MKVGVGAVRVWELGEGGEGGGVRGCKSLTACGFARQLVLLPPTHCCRDSEELGRTW